MSGDIFLLSILNTDRISFLDIAGSHGKVAVITSAGVNVDAAPVISTGGEAIDSKVRTVAHDAVASAILNGDVLHSHLSSVVEVQAVLGLFVTVDGEIFDGDVSVFLNVDHTGSVGSVASYGDLFAVTVQSDVFGNLQDSTGVLYTTLVNIDIFQQGDGVAILRSIDGVSQGVIRDTIYCGLVIACFILDCTVNRSVDIDNIAVLGCGTANRAVHKAEGAGVACVLGNVTGNGAVGDAHVTSAVFGNITVNRGVVHRHGTKAAGLQGAV